MAVGLETRTDHPRLPEKVLDLIPGEAGVGLLLLGVEVKMTFDYAEMVKEVVKTGQPVTRSRQLGCHNKAPASVAEMTLDATAKVASPQHQPIKKHLSVLGKPRRWGLAPAQRPQSNLLTPRYASQSEITPEKVAESIQQLDRSGIPACMRNSQQADFYVSLVGHEFFSQNNLVKNKIIRAAGGNDADVRFLQSHSCLDDFLPWVVKKLSRAPLISALVLGNLMGLKPEFCFSAFPEASRQRAQDSTGAPVEDATPKSIVVGGINFKRLHMDIQRDLNGAVTQAVCHYSDGKNDIFALAVRISSQQDKDLLKIGMEAAAPHLLSRDMIVRYPKASVLICMDIKVAISLREAARDGHVFDRTGVIVSGFAGGEETQKGLLLSDLAGHSVTIVSAPGQEGWDEVDLLAKHCIAKWAANVSVYPWPIVQGDAPDISLYKPEMQDVLLAKTTDLDSLELPSQLVARIRREAIPIEDMTSWKKSVLLLEATTVRTKSEQSCQTDFKIVTFDMLPDVVPREDDVPATVRQMFSPRYTTLIWGASNAGKSWMGIELAISLTTGTPYLYFTASAPCDLCYLDGEVGSDFKPRVNQLLQGREEFLPLLNKKLSVISAKGGFNILDKKMQESLIGRLQEAGVEYMIIDNLLSLAPTASKSNATPLFDFIHRVEKLNIGVIVLHHAGKTGKDFKGPVDLASLCQNVIHLEGRDQLEGEMPKGHEGDGEWLSPELASALKEDGPVVRMTIEKCKVAPEIERREMVYKLPVGGIWAFVEGDLPTPISKSSDSPIIEGTPVTLPAESIPLPPDALKLLDALAAGRSYSRIDLEKTTGFTEKQTRKALKALLDIKLVSRGGEGKSTYYFKS